MNRLWQAIEFIQKSPRKPIIVSLDQIRLGNPMAKQATNNRIVIDETTDKKVDSLALAITFVSLGIVLTIIPTFFDNEFVTSAIRWTFIVVGIIGLMSSFGDKESSIKGASDIGVGVLLLALAVACYIWMPLWLPSPINGIIGILLMLIGFFGSIRGVLFLVISTSRLWKKQKADSSTKGSALLFVEMITKLAALVLAVVQIVKLMN